MHVYSTIHLPANKADVMQVTWNPAWPSNSMWFCSLSAIIFRMMLQPRHYWQKSRWALLNWIWMQSSEPALSNVVLFCHMGCSATCEMWLMQETVINVLFCHAQKYKTTRWDSQYSINPDHSSSFNYVKSYFLTVMMELCGAIVLCFATKWDQFDTYYIWNWGSHTQQC